MAKPDIENKQFVFTSENILEIMEKQNQGMILPRHMNPWFKNQVGVRKVGCTFGWTDEELMEYAKCSVDIHYFANHFCKIKGEDGRTYQMILRDYQYDILTAYYLNRFTLNMSSRQTGKTICAAITMLHYAIFNNDKGIMIVANKADTVVEIIDKIKNIYKLLPFFLKPGIINWNTKNIVFGNGCRIKSQARSKEPAIGFAIDFLYMDEFAHIPKTIVNHYYRAAVPTVSSIKDSKIIITSTPNGSGLFKDLVMGAQLPEGHPDKNQYKFVKVYWYQVPDGKFKDGTRGTRLDARLYVDESKFKKYKTSLSASTKMLKDLGYKCAEEEEDTDNGTRYFIRIAYKEGKTDLETLRNTKIGGINLTQLFNLTNWQEQETKLIGGTEAFNQEYNLQFIAGSKRILSANKAIELEKRMVKYQHKAIDILDKKLRIDYEDLKFRPNFNFNDINSKYWATFIDTSEGLGLDYTVINGFTLEVIDKEWLQTNKIKSLYEAFLLKQQFIFNNNNINHKDELPDLYYLLHFEWLNPERTKTVLEYNGPGGTFLNGLPNCFQGNNKYGSYIFTRYKHRITDTKKKIGIRVSGANKKEMVKSYITSIESNRLYVDEETTISEMDNFVKVETKAGNFTYKGDCSHDDIVMTLVNGSTFFETQDFKNMCLNYYKELPQEVQNIIDASMDLEYNTEAVSYKSMSNALKNTRNTDASTRRRMTQLQTRRK